MVWMVLLYSFARELAAEAGFNFVAGAKGCRARGTSGGEMVPTMRCEFLGLGTSGGKMIPTARREM